VTGSPAAAPPDAVRRPGRRRGLRFRVVVAFSVGSFIISATVAIATYALCQRYLVDQRERALIRQTWSDARIAEQVLASSDRSRALEELEPAADVRVLVRTSEGWFASGVGVDPSDLPSGLRAAVRDGVPAHQRIELRGSKVFVAGVPLPSVAAEFYEFTTMNQLNRTLRTISTALAIGGALATLLGAALALWASRLVLRPLTDAAAAAEAVAAGDLDARLEEYADPDLGRLSESFNEMVDAVQHRLQREASFSSDVSHELRSPITTLAAATELMARRRDQLSPEVQEILDLLRADISRFSQLVEDLLEISRADAGAEELRLEPVSAPEFLEHCLTRADLSVPVAVGSDAARAPVFVDKRRLARVVDNLAANAEAYAGGLTAVRVDRDGDTLVLELEDRGPGVDPTERALIFERFHRGIAAGRRGSTKGSGLGLALVAEQVRLHGGRIEVRPGAHGVGACFVVEIPWREGP
jgi:two-component system sensor histidine kinase MtrB